MCLFGKRKPEMPKYRIVRVSSLKETYYIIETWDRMDRVYYNWTETHYTELNDAKDYIENINSITRTVVG